MDRGSGRSGPRWSGSARGGTYPGAAERVNRREPVVPPLPEPLTAADDGSGWRDTLARWAHENSADTRLAEGPEGRVYGVAFARVWDEVLAEIERRRRWTLSHKDEELGIITVSCRSRVLRLVDDMTIWVALDENGLTRVDILSRARTGKGDLGVNRRRIERLLLHLDRALGPRSRVVGDASPGSGEPSGG